MWANEINDYLRINSSLDDEKVAQALSQLYVVAL